MHQLVNASINKLKFLTRKPLMLLARKDRTKYACTLVSTGRQMTQSTRCEMMVMH